MSSEPTHVAMPLEPCLVISDGETVVVATERTCEPVRRWALTVGPITRATTVARLRAFADLIETADKEATR